MTVKICHSLYFGNIATTGIAIIVLLFAFTSIIGNYYYGEINIKHLSDNPLYLNIFRILVVIMVFFGGVNSLTGSIFGGAFLTFLPQYMQALNKYRAVVYAVLVLFILNFKPKGVFGEWELTPKNMRRALMRFNRKQRKVKER